MLIGHVGRRSLELAGGPVSSIGAEKDRHPRNGRHAVGNAYLRFLREQG